MVNKLSAMSLSLMFRLFAAAVLAATGTAVCASSSLAESRPTITFELAAGEQELFAKPFLEQWAALSPEERQQMRGQIRDHWRNLPPEERQKRREENHGRWQQMSPEERQQIRETIRERRGGDDSAGQGFDRGRR